MILVTWHSITLRHYNTDIIFLRKSRVNILYFDDIFPRPYSLLHFRLKPSFILYTDSTVYNDTFENKIFIVLHTYTLNVSQYTTPNNEKKRKDSFVIV